jgi:hypothetical protein
MTDQTDKTPRRRKRPQTAAPDPTSDAPQGEPQGHDTERGPTRAQLRMLYLYKIKGLRACCIIARTDGYVWGRTRDRARSISHSGSVSELSGPHPS